MQVPFPLHALCRSVWKNVEGQLSFLRYAVSAPPEVFTFAHSSRKLVWFAACPRILHLQNFFVLFFFLLMALPFISCRRVLMH